MKKLWIVLGVLFFSCTTFQKPENKLELTLNSKSESKVNGKVIISEKKGIVTLQAKMTGLTPGEHAIHIHEKADCIAADGSSAGAHWNPTFKKHGKWGQGECHKGDIGNFIADGNGNGSINFSTSEWCIGCADETKNIIGKSIIVHKGADDFISQPAGNAGVRQACSGVIK